jgi:signal peptidase II
MLRQLPGDSRFLPVVLGLIFGGAVGNGIDRVHQQVVTDFLRFYTESPGLKARLIDWFGTNEYPSFNIADAALVIGVALFVIHYLFLDEGEGEKKEPAATEETA